VTTPAVIAIVGATATGKTALAESVAAALDGEIVCADSRQVFRELELGTGKPTPAERAQRPHHLFEALGLGARANAGWYARAAGEACAAIRARGRRPVLVGGSGLYLRAARAGLAPAPPRSPRIRAALEARLARDGLDVLRRSLAASDPETAARLGRGDRQRVIRALEVLEASGRPLSWWHRAPHEAAVPGPWRTIELVLEPRAAGERIERRARWMFDAGLLEETEALRARGLEPALAVLRAIGYDESLACLAGAMTRDEAIARTALRTRQLAKRQRTWFRGERDAVRLDAALPEAALVARTLAVVRG